MNVTGNLGADILGWIIMGIFALGFLGMVGWVAISLGTEIYESIRLTRIMRATERELRRQA